jgi:hypothetical protein
VCSDYIAFLVDYDECWPRSHGIGAPNAELPVVDYRVGESEAERRFEYPGRFPLCDIFSTVNSDDDDVVRISLLDLPQLRKNVDAVDSAIGPEIEENDLAA